MVHLDSVDIQTALNTYARALVLDLKQLLKVARQQAVVHKVELLYS